MGRMALLLTGALTLAALSSAPARADIIHHLINPGTISKFCKSNNGTYWPTSVGHTYGCYWDDSVVVCGGITPEQAGTCYETREAPHKGPKPPWFNDHDKR